MSGYLLLLTILLLGGSIAMMGDRLGFKVGKARLTIFGLRPKHTATVATFITGVLVSAATLGVILLVDSQIRVGLFKLNDLQRDLEQAQQQGQQIQTELALTQQQRLQAEGQLQRTRQALQTAQRQTQNTERQLTKLQQQVVQVQGRSRQAEQKLTQSQALVIALQREEDRLQSRQQRLQLSNRTLQTQLSEKRSDLTRLTSEVALLQQNNAGLSLDFLKVRKGDVVIRDQQILATGVIRRGLTLKQQKDTLDRLLLLGEKTARTLGAAPAGNDRALLILPQDAAQILALLQPNQDNIVQLRAGYNTIKGEPVIVVPKLLPNALIFGEGEVMASREVALPLGDEQQIFRELFQQAGQRARVGGVLEQQDGKVGTFPQNETAYLQMLSDLRGGKGSVTLQAITSKDIYTVGPLTLSLVVLQEGKVVARVT